MLHLCLNFLTVRHFASRILQMQVVLHFSKIYSRLLSFLGGFLPLSEEEKNYFYKTFGNIADEVYIEKIVPQWAETQEDKQNAVDYTGMYDQKTVRYKKVCPFIFMYLHINHDGIVSPCTLDWPIKSTWTNNSIMIYMKIHEDKGAHFFVSNCFLIIHTCIIHCILFIFLSFCPLRNNFFYVNFVSNIAECFIKIIFFFF